MKPLLILLIVTAALFYLLWPTSQGNTSEGYTGPFPRTTLLTADNKKITLPLAGEPFILNVFASWCGGCVVEMPVLMKLKETGIKIYGISADKSYRDVSAFLSRQGNPYAAITMDPQAILLRSLNLSGGLPETFLVDPQGNIIRHHFGPLKNSDYYDYKRYIAAWGRKP